MFFSKLKHIPTSRIYPLQFRKIWKKIILLEFSPSRDGQKLWRSVFLSLFAIAGLYAAIGVMFSKEGVLAINWVKFFAPLILIWGALLFYAVIYEWLYIWTYLYDVGDNFLKIRKGVLIRREASVPYAKIQDVYVDQDALDHIFQLYDVHVSTAAHDTENFVSHIDGLNSVNAKKIRDLILAKLEKANQLHNHSGV